MTMLGAQATARLGVVTTILLCALCGPASANVFPDASGRDPRKLEARAAWSPVALVRSNVDRVTGEVRGEPTGAAGTGFMVSPCYLLTNYHVAFGDVAGRGDLPGAWLTVQLGTPAREYRTTIEAAGDLGAQPGLGDGDWVLARVAGCPGKRRDVGWLPIADPGSLSLNNKVLIAGFPKDHAYPQIAVHRGCAIRARTDTGVLIHDCATGNGQSGSPLMTYGEEGLAVLGMVTGEIDPAETIVAYRPGHENANYALPVADIVKHPKVAAVVAADFALAGRNGFKSPRVARTRD